MDEMTKREALRLIQQLEDGVGNDEDGEQLDLLKQLREKLGTTTPKFTDPQTAATYIKQFAHDLVAANLNKVNPDPKTDLQTIDWIGTSLLMQGAVVLMQAGCPPQVVMQRVHAAAMELQQALGGGAAPPPAEPKSKLIV